jgi:hypothetical protein
LNLVQNIPVTDKPPEAPKKPEAPPAPVAASKPVEPLLALSPTPSATDAVRIPPGEARGRFVISPQPNPGGSDTDPGIGNRSTSATNAGGTAASGTGTGTGGGDGKDKGSAAGGTAAGSANGTGAGTGTGTGTGAGKGAFPGITILGAGTLENKGTANTNMISIGGMGGPPKPPSSYGLTVVSNEAGGGGLPQFGVFSNDQIYTVYLDMRRIPTDPPHTWTFEYAAVAKTPSPTTGITTLNSGQQGLVLPYPIVKERPALTAEVLQKYKGRQVIVFGIINAEGKMEQISVKDSPDPGINEPISHTLGKWTFRPGQLGGERVAMKVLLGFSLALP